jgi:hypothetical protein
VLINTLLCCGVYVGCVTSSVRISKDETDVMRLFGISEGVCMGMNLVCRCEERRRFGVFQRKVQVRGEEEEAKRKLQKTPIRSSSIFTVHIVFLYLLSKDGWDRRHVGVKKRKANTGRKYNVKRMQSSV